MKEVWKDISNFKGVYQVSSLGRVRSLDMMINQKLGSKRLKPGRVLKPRLNRQGYAQYALYNEIKHFPSAHRLVAQAFIPNPENKPEVNHINGIKDDNRVENLEWCTRNENLKHGYRTGLISHVGSNSNRTHLTESDVLEIRKLCNESEYTYERIGQKYNVSKSCICDINRRKTWKHV